MIYSFMDIPIRAVLNKIDCSFAFFILKHRLFFCIFLILPLHLCFPSPLNIFLLNTNKQLEWYTISKSISTINITLFEPEARDSKISSDKIIRFKVQKKNNSFYVYNIFTINKFYPRIALVISTYNPHYTTYISKFFLVNFGFKNHLVVEQKKRKRILLHWSNSNEQLSYV